MLYTLWEKPFYRDVLALECGMGAKMDDCKPKRIIFDSDLRERAFEDVQMPGGIRRLADLVDRSATNGALDFIEAAYETARREGAVIVELSDGDLLIEYDGDNYVVKEL